MHCSIELIDAVTSPLCWRALHSLSPIGTERCPDLRRCFTGIHVIGDSVMDSNNRVRRRECFEILEIVQGLGEGVVAVDKGQLKPLRPNTIFGALEESIARRNREGRTWPAFLDLFWIGAPGRRSAAKRSPKMRHDRSRRT